MKLYLFILLLAAPLVLKAQLGVLPADISAEDRFYLTMVDEAAGGRTIDFTQLRLAYAASSLANNYIDVRPAFAGYIDSGDWNGALQLIRDNFYLWFALLDFADYAVYIYSRLEGPTSSNAAFFNFVGQGLMRSLLSNGTALSQAEAITVINIREGYWVANQLGIRVHSHRVLENNGQTFDVLTGRNLAGDEIELFFNTSLFR
ncbi:MAG: hypothetical protein FWE37_05585 [Spirochaetaceae bacterium]|nr:hypothetical protein [Spirochaetaceae bacterium]